MLNDALIRYPSAGAVLLLLAALPPAHAAEVFSCNQDILPYASGKFPYGPSRHGAYCEGTYDRVVRGSPLELLSLTSGAVEHDHTSDEAIRIRVAVQGGSDRRPIHIVATSKSSAVSYRLDARLRAGSSLPVKPDAVLGPLGLTADQLGAYGLHGDPPDQSFVPLIVGQTQQPDAGDRERIAVSVRSMQATGPIDVKVERAMSTPGAAAIWREVDRYGVDPEGVVDFFVEHQGSPALRVTIRAARLARRSAGADAPGAPSAAPPYSYLTLDIRRRL